MHKIVKFLPMKGFELRTSGIGSDRSTNIATASGHSVKLVIDHLNRNAFMKLAILISYLYIPFQSVLSQSATLSHWSHRAEPPEPYRLSSWQRIPMIE